MIGLLVAACVNRAPEGTFGAAIAEVGVFDYLRVCCQPFSRIFSSKILPLIVPTIYHRKSMDASRISLTISQLLILFINSSDYGDPSNPEDFDFMYPISPLHNVDTGDKVLPPMLLLTADRDYIYNYVYNSSD